MIGEAVTRIRTQSAGVDRHGNPVPGDPVESPLFGALFAPGSTSEPFEVGRAAVIAEPTLYFPRTWPDLRPTDQVRVRGGVFEVIGDPSDWRSAYATAAGGLVVTLKRVEG